MNTTSSIRRIVTTFIHLSVITVFSAAIINPQPVLADTTPPVGTPETVSVDPLPTVQINGIVRRQAISGNTVYAVGEFTKARPAGSPLGVNEVTRTHLLAYDIRTGNLITSFNHTLDAKARAVTVSPDNKRLYVGGDFTTVNGKAHQHIAAFDIASGALIDSFTAGLKKPVATLAATNTAVYAGGAFFSTSSGAARDRLAAFTAAGTLLPWAPSANSTVLAMVMSPDKTKVIIGGTFSLLNGIKYHGIGAVAASGTGTNVAWASQSDTYPVRAEDPINSGAGVYSLSADANNVYFTAYNAILRSRTGGFEGRGAINPTNGAIIWINDCHGDSYDAFPIGPVLYSAGHSHDCEPAGAFAETLPFTHYRALAETIAPTGVNGNPTQGYFGHKGQPRSTQLNWYPSLNIGDYSKQSQAAWSVVGNSQYVAYGGEFPEVDGVKQQGLVRYGIKSLTTNKTAPQTFVDHAVTALPVTANGTSNIYLTLTSDRDNGVLKYELYRDGGTTPINTFSRDSRFWNLPVVAFTDSGLQPGSAHSYQLKATDPFGNTRLSTVEPNTGLKPVVGDWNGDRTAELATYTKGSTPSWYINPANYAQASLFGVANDLAVPVPGDYNRDGKTDLATWSKKDFKWRINFSGTATFNKTVEWGTAGDIPVPADYNGDGKTDVAIYRPSSRVWRIMEGNQSIQWGNPGDIPVPADYNGDGKTDVAIYRPSTGVWHIRGITQIQYGQAGDIPAPADYNGDGTIDLAVLRPASQLYYVRAKAAVKVNGRTPLALPYAIQSSFFPTNY